MRSLNEHMEELNELSLETYTKAIQKAQGREGKQSKNIEKLALELIKRGETEKVKDKRETVNKIVLRNGTVEYRNYKGQLHRVDGPAVEHTNGDKYWYLNGMCNRENGPAIEYSDGSLYWYLNGKLHRVDGPAIENTNGTKSWYLNDKRHREDGPAIEYSDGSKEWYLNDKCHRVDGPAREYSDGDKEWYLNDKKYSEEEFNKKMNK